MGRTPELGSYDRGNTPRRVKLTGSVAMTLLTVPGLAAIISACGGGGNDTPSDTGQITETPILSTPSPLIESPTPVKTEAPTIAPTPEPTPVITPEATPKVNPLDIINKGISFIENLPLPEGMNPGTWELAKFNTLQGSHDQGGNYGLYDLRTALETGKNDQANQMLDFNLFTHITGFARLDTTPTVILTKDEIVKLDPKNLLLRSDFNFFRLVTSTKDVSFDLIKLKYALQP
ncbi:MAG: hypothetical protein AAB531_01355 [Patescibacteria group bacterium]